MEPPLPLLLMRAHRFNARSLLSLRPRNTNAFSSSQIFTPTRHRSQLFNHSKQDKCPIWIFRENGDKTFAQLSRKQLMAELSVSARLVRLIDGSHVNRHPVVAAHGRSVIVSLDNNIRLVIKRDKTIMLDPCTPTGVRLHAALSKSLARTHGPDSITLMAPADLPADNIKFHGDPEAVFSSALELDEVPFVMRSMDGILKFVTADMERQLFTLSTAVSSALLMLGRSATDDVLQKLIPLKSSLQAFKVRLDEFKEAVDDVATDEKQLKRFDLDGAFTSNPSCIKLLEGSPMDANYELLEEIFDHYYYIADEMANEVERLLKDIRGHEEVLSITLDSQRNELINLNLFVSSGALVMGSAAMVAGLFGMNAHVEESLQIVGLYQPLAFPIIASTIVGGSGALFFGFYKHYRQVVSGRKSAVHAQVVLDTLLWRADQIEAMLIKLYASDRRLTLEQFDFLLKECGVKLEKSETGSIFNLFAGADGIIDSDYFMSVLHQRKQGTRTEVLHAD